MTDMDSTSAKLHDALSRIVRDERSAMASKCPAFYSGRGLIYPITHQRETR